MRQSFLIILAFWSISTAAQEKSISFRAGYSIPFAPYGVYSDNVSSAYANNDLTFYPFDGYVLNFDTEIKSPKPFMSYRIGAFYTYSGTYDNYEDDQQISEAWLYLTGAGVYCGLSFKAGWERFGIFNSFSAGYFSFDYRMEMQYTSKLGVIPVSSMAGEAVAGPGGKFEMGLYGTYKALSVYPSFQMLFVSNRQSQALLLKTINISAGYTF